ncbi:hypothetical protein GSI_03300 [Ganoderma sinense ZZ0214-1]|uniref:Uncharacterized protein n=1 Tax=Ganoderma sinense ZZ0214-1 TaxID=1077348 RepID=A0A2G8SL87_9APHY|nr:hypothetical protein GSI_03300 [Ganoderma sinense ZZ0214-1]
MADAAFPIDVAQIVALFLESLFYGPGGAVAEFSDISYWVNAMKMVTFVAQTSIADGMLIYRCYIVYSGSWFVAAPLCILWAAGIVMEAFTCVLEFTTRGSTSKLINIAQITPFITSMFAITLVLNTIATSLIVYKIWSIEHSAKVFVITGGTDTTRLRRAMHIIIESGLMYTVSVVILFILYLASNNAQYAVSDCIVQIIGIAFNLIIIRIDQGRAATSKTMTTLISARDQERGGRFGHRSPVRFRFSRQTTTCSSITDVDSAFDVERGLRAPAVAMMAFKRASALSPTDPEEDLLASLKSPV